MKFTSAKIIFIAAFTWMYCVINLGNFKSHHVIVQDVISYYSYLPATFIQHDLKLDFLDDTAYKPLPDSYWHFTTSGGAKVFKMTMGLSFLYAPFFFIAHLCAKVLGYDADGFSTPYQLSLCISSIFYCCMGLILLRKLLLNYFEDKVVAFTLLIICFGTNLFYYVSNEGALTHAFSFFLFAALLLFNEKWHRNPTFILSVLFGLTFGLITLVRPSNAVLVLLPLLYQVNDKASMLAKFQLIKTNFLKICIAIIGSFLVWVPQLLYWKVVTGQWLFYSYADENFFFLKPHIAEVLFSFRKGWLIYTPLMIFAIAGFISLRKKMQNYFFAILIFMIANVYVISSWWCWWYGGSYGMRTMIESYAVLAIPLAIIIQRLLSNKIFVKKVLVSLVGILIVWNLYLTYQYKRGIIHYDSMTAKAYTTLFYNFHKPDNFEKLLSPPDYNAAMKGEEKYSW